MNVAGNNVTRPAPIRRNAGHYGVNSRWTTWKQKPESAAVAHS